MEKLPEKSQTFISHFGEMGSRWGINRTVGQIYALLYLSKEPLNADDICEALSFSRSNVSMAIRELISLNLIKINHKRGERKEYFSTPEDIWQIFRNLIEERRKREIEPTLSLLRDLLMDEKNEDEKKSTYQIKKMQEMYNLIDLMTKWHDDMKNVDSKNLKRLFKLGSGILKFFKKDK
jgi:DNA-binding transcriptional regulator GbsR (MarR family)